MAENNKVAEDKAGPMTTAEALAAAAAARTPMAPRDLEETGVSREMFDELSARVAALEKKSK
jgi:hypothetical protein